MPHQLEILLTDAQKRVVEKRFKSNHATGETQYWVVAFELGFVTLVQLP